MTRTLGSAFLKHLIPIIKTYKDGSGKPLDGDEVDRLIRHIRNAVNLQEGNITGKEYVILETTR